MRFLAAWLFFSKLQARRLGRFIAAGVLNCAGNDGFIEHFRRVGVGIGAHRRCRFS